MCVIAYSPKGNDAPTEADIRKMFTKNPDGAGYAYEERGVVHFKKGFMNVEDLLEDLGPLENWKNKAIAMHFRIGTAGKNDQKTTHPFPMTNNFGEMRKLEGEGPVLFHNGVITGFGGLIDPLSSDTQDFVAGVASKLLAKPHRPSKVVEKVIDELIGASKLLIMYGKGKVVQFGDWKFKNGNQYSNMYWDVEPKQEYSRTSTCTYYSGYGCSGYSTWDKWEDEEEEYYQAFSNEDQMKAFVSDADEIDSYIYRKPDGTVWYVDPDYMEAWAYDEEDDSVIDLTEYKQMELVNG